MVFTKLRSRDPHMLWWVEIMACTGDGGTKVNYKNPFFCWLDDQILMIEDYAYTGTDFQGDPYLPLLADSQWGDISKKQSSIC